MKFVVLTAVLCCFLMPASSVWDKVDYERCLPRENGQWAVGFKLKTQQPQDGGDDTALNGIALKCADGKWITSTVGP
jgi:hypothetical protein